MNDNIIYEIVADCQEWIAKSEYKEWRGPAISLVKFIVTSNRKYEWVRQEEVKEATKLLTEILDHSKMPTVPTEKKNSSVSISLHCRACGGTIYGKDDLCNDCIKESKETLKDMLWKEGYSWSSINECVEGE